MGRVVLAAASAVVAEVAVFVLVARWLGLGWAVLLVLAASLVGGVLLQRQSVQAWRGLREAAAAGQPPGVQVVDGLVRLAGALLLAVPGLLSGLVGAVLLVPPVRWLVRGRTERWAERSLSPAAAGELFGPRRVRVKRGTPRPPEPQPGPHPTIEGEIVGGTEDR